MLYLFMNLMYSLSYSFHSSVKYAWIDLITICCLIVRVKLEDPDSDDEEDNCTLVVGVIQKHRRKIKKLGAQNLTIGFSIYKVNALYSCNESSLYLPWKSRALLIFLVIMIKIIE